MKLVVIISRFLFSREAKKTLNLLCELKYVSYIRKYMINELLIVTIDVGNLVIVAFHNFSDVPDVFLFTGEHLFDYIILFSVPFCRLQKLGRTVVTQIGHRHKWGTIGVAQTGQWFHCFVRVDIVAVETTDRFGWQKLWHSQVFNCYCKNRSLLSLYWFLYSNFTFWLSTCFVYISNRSARFIYKHKSI